MAVAGTPVGNRVGGTGVTVGVDVVVAVAVGVGVRVGVAVVVAVAVGVVAAAVGVAVVVAVSVGVAVRVGVPVTVCAPTPSVQSIKPPMRMRKPSTRRHIATPSMPTKVRQPWHGDSERVKRAARRAAACADRFSVLRIHGARRGGG